jgi:hypothetical protein
MATSYTGLRVQDTYNAIIKIGDNSNLTATPKLLSDGLGNDSPLYLSGTRLGIGISPAYQFHTSGNAKIGGNLIVSGNLTVNGTLTYLNVQDLAVEDPIIKLAKDNTANTLDIGLFGKYVATGTKYKGFFNDASDDKFKLFIGTTVEPTTTVDTSASGYTIGTLVANIEGTTGTFSGLLKSDTLELTSGADHLTFTESSGDWTINNSQQNNGITIYDSTGGVDINYASSAYLQVDNTGVHTQTNIDFYVDTNLIYADAANNKVGIGVTAPDYKLEVNGQIASNNYIIAGLGNGGVALTHNDGYGNANVTFNHVSGTPEQDGSSGRIVVTTDGTTAKMTFELKDDVTSGDAVDTPQIMELYSSSIVANQKFRTRTTTGGHIYLERNDTTIGTGNHIGTLHFSGDDPTDGTFNDGAAIKITAVSGWSADDYPSRIELQTDNSGTLTTALTIDESQNATFANNVTIPETPTADAHAASKKYVDDNLIPAQSLSNVLGVGNTSGANDIIMADDQKINFGTDSDLQIYHDDTDGYIKNEKGNLIIEQTTDAADIVFKSDNGSGDTIEYFRVDGSTNTIPFGRSPHIVDNVKLYFGNETANDASIKWDSTANELFIDGESKFLDNLAVVGAIKDSDGDAGTSGQLLSSTGTGTNWIDFEADTAKRLEVDVKNVHGATLAKGTVVHAEPTGTLSGNVIEVVAADANSGRMPAIGVLNEALLDDDEGKAVMFGTVQGIDTSAFSVGDELYVSATAGQFTATKPIATTEEVQKIAIVIKSHASNGLIKVFGAGRANDVPNLLTRNITIDGADFYFRNGDQIRMGDSIGLRIQHNGSNSFIDGEIGSMYFRAEANNSAMYFQADDGSGGNATYIEINGDDERIYVNRLMRFNDNVELRLGENNDIRLYHNSTSGNGNIENHNGSLYITNYADDEDIIFRTDNGSGDVIEYFRLDGSTNTVPFGRSPHIVDNLKLYFGNDTANDASIKWDSTASQLFIDGVSKFLSNVYFTSNAYFGDNDKLYFGDLTTPDLEIYHDGSNSYIRELGTGNLYLDTNGTQVIISTNATAKTAATFTNNGSVDLYYNNSKKFETTNTGVTVTGGGTFTGDVNVGANTNATRKIELSGGRAVYEYDTTKGTSGAIVIQGSANKEIHFETTADTPDMIIDSSGNVGIGTTSPDTKLEIVGNNPILTIRDSDTSSSTATSTIRFAESNASDTLGNYWDVGYSPVNLLNFDFNGSTKMTINSSGNVGINDTSPSHKLHVSSGNGDTARTVNVSHTRNDPDTGSDAIFVDANYSGTKSNATDIEQTGIRIDLDSSANGDATNEHRIIGIKSDTRNSGFADIVRGGYFYAESNYTGAKTAEVVGAYGIATHDANSASGGVSNLYGTRGVAQVQDDGDVDNAYGLHGQVFIANNRDANVDNATAIYGEVQIDEQTALTYDNIIGTRIIIDNNEGAVPTISNSYLFYGTYTGTKSANAWGIYVQGDKNYLQGNLGIGTTSAAEKLEVSGSVKIGNLKIQNANSGRIGFNRNTATGAIYDSNSSAIQINGPSSSLNYLSIEAYNSSGNFTSQMVYTGNGRVGINSTNPAGLLTINGTGDAIRVESTNTGVGGAQMDLLHFTSSPADGDNFAMINMGGYYTGTTSVYGTSIKSIWTDVSARDAKLTFSTNNSGTLTEQMVITSNGKVGIKTDPTYNLQVQKSSQASPAIMIGGAYYGGPRLQTYGLDADANAWMGLGTDMSGAPYEHNVYFSDHNNYGRLSFGTYNGTTYSEKMAITRAGLIGIGGEPSHILHIKQDSATNLVNLIEQDNASYQAYYEAKSQNNGYARFGIGTNASAEAFFNTSVSSYTWNHTGGGLLMTLNSNGHLGLGITNLTFAKLAVNGATYSSGGTFNAGTDTVTNAAFVVDEEDWIYTRDSSQYARKLIGKTNDIIQIGQSGTSLVQGIEFYSGSDQCNYKWYRNTSVAMQLTGSGSQPYEILDVKGRIKAETDNGSAVNVPRSKSISYQGASGYYDFDPVAEFGQSKSGGYVLLEVNGWQTRFNAGYIHWNNNGTGAGAIGTGSVTYRQIAWSGSSSGAGVTVSLPSSSTNVIRISFSGWHSNNHGWTANIINRW